MQELEQHAEMANSQNEELRSTVAQLKEESMYLRNMLLTHGNCDCETVVSLFFNFS
jgi:Icc-related predicted phosphoesterase